MMMNKKLYTYLRLVTSVALSAVDMVPGESDGTFVSRLPLLVCKLNVLTNGFSDAVECRRAALVMYFWHCCLIANNRRRFSE